MRIFGKKVKPIHIVLALAIVLIIGAITFRTNPISAVKPLAVVHVGEIVYPGDTFEHTFTLTNRDAVDLPDLDPSDGKVTRLYKTYRMFDQAGNKIQEGYEEITEVIPPGGSATYSISLDVTDETPSGKYAVSAILFKVTQTWDRTTNTWSTSDPVIIDGSEQNPALAIEFEVQTPTPPPNISVETIWNWIANLFASIWNFIKGLFGWV